MNMAMVSSGGQQCNQLREPSLKWRALPIALLFTRDGGFYYHRKSGGQRLGISCSLEKTGPGNARCCCSAVSPLFKHGGPK